MIDLIIHSRPRSLGGFDVNRLLPFAERRMVGPFVFFDHFGPVDFPRGIPRAVDVRPHPHIGLSTVTYLFDGEIMHRDSLGSEQPIRPGEVNWMTAGRGITHSERFERARARRRRDARHPGVGGAARSSTKRPIPPSRIIATTDLPTYEGGGLWARLVAGEAFGAKAEGEDPLADVLCALAPRSGREGAASRRIQRTRGLYRLRTGRDRRRAP